MVFIAVVILAAPKNDCQGISMIGGPSSNFRASHETQVASRTRNEWKLMNRLA